MAKGLSPTQRTLRAMREMGRVAAIVERFNPYGGPTVNGKRVGVRQDLFGILDIIALDPERGVVGIQSCGVSYSQHWQKLTHDEAERTHTWLSTPGACLELWSWRKTKRKLESGYSRASYWTPRIRVITLDDLQ